MKEVNSVFLLIAKPSPVQLSDMRKMQSKKKEFIPCITF
jgi:hypothetical protein